MAIRDLATDGQAAKNTVIAEMVAAGTDLRQCQAAFQKLSPAM
jgi:hypothetical protein